MRTPVPYPDGLSQRELPPALTPTSHWRPDAVDRFSAFVTERHRIFVRRLVHRLPPPWTADPILASVYLCNVYRELDRGSRTVVTDILEPSASDAAPDRLFNLYLYRTFNLPETYVALGGYRPAAEWDLRWMEATLLERQAQGHKVFSSAYRSAAATRTPGRGQRTRDWVARLGQIRDLVASIWTDIEHATENPDPVRGMARTHGILQRPPGVGDFFAFQVLLDMMYEPRILPAHFHEDVWTHVGEGAHDGLALLIALRVGWGSPAELAALRELRDAYNARLACAPHGLVAPPLTLANCEFALCEYHKYAAACAGQAPKRRFTRANPDVSPWAGIPAAFRPLRCPV